MTALRTKLAQAAWDHREGRLAPSVRVPWGRASDGQRADMMKLADAMYDASTMVCHRTTCRLCDSTNVSKIVAMPACPPVDNYRFAHEAEIRLPAFPMDLYQCRDCGHAQLLDIVDPEILYGNYIYTSTGSPDMDRHFSAYADELVAIKHLDPRHLVVDIGSNDGLFLSKLKRRVRILGIDASEHMAERARAGGIPTIAGFIEQMNLKPVIAEHGQADVVTANNVFSHADDLRGFVQGVKRLLKPDGMFVFEVAYLGALVENKLLDYVYHEHLAYHSIVPLKRFLESEGMTLLGVGPIQTKGGSIRCLAARTEAGYQSNGIAEIMEATERAMGLYDPETYWALTQDITVIGDQVRLLFDDARAKGQIVASYGACATATVLNALLDVNRYFAFIVDDNPARHGRLSPGALIPVRTRLHLLETMPALTLISSWRFADQIVARNQEYLDRGGRFVLPLPELRVIGR